MARHDDACPILDDEEILKLRDFVHDPVAAQTAQTEFASGSLVAHIIRDWATEGTLLTEREVEDLQKWFANGGGKTDAENVEGGK